VETRITRASITVGTGLSIDIGANGNLSISPDFSIEQDLRDVIDVEEAGPATNIGAGESAHWTIDVNDISEAATSRLFVEFSAAWKCSIELNDDALLSCS
jgi:hypothetical protein